MTARLTAAEHLALLAQVGGAIETTIHPDSWRRPDAVTAGWLRYLVSVGYEPADVERLILDHAPDVDADDGAPDEDPAADHLRQRLTALAAPC
ncbi:MAG: hypothetical protein M3Q17_11805, partial [Actinomycetota bacterium]|nr:hypothetical protein [Actinomycetota bacterium]